MSPSRPGRSPSRRLSRRRSRRRSRSRPWPTRCRPWRWSVTEPVTATPAASRRRSSLTSSPRLDRPRHRRCPQAARSSSRWIGRAMTARFFAGTGGFTPLPSAMALGATWSPSLAEQTGQVVGQELLAAGVNLLLGPTLDVLDVPRPGSKGDLGTRTFGGDPFWVGQLGQAFIRGVQTGSDGAIATVAKHFPGQGASDRRPDDEVATVQKSHASAAPDRACAVRRGDRRRRARRRAGTTAALMTSHIRYRGFQGNIRQLTPPISLAPQLQDLMALPEFADWRTQRRRAGQRCAGRAGDPPLLRPDAHQVPASPGGPGRVSRRQRPALPGPLCADRRLAQPDDGDHRDDPVLPGEVSDRQRASGPGWTPRWNASSGSSRASTAATGAVEALSRDVAGLGEETGQARQRDASRGACRADPDLSGPGRAGRPHAQRAPGRREHRDLHRCAAVRECADCAATPLIAANALEEIILRLYGPNATGQISAKQIRSFTYADLSRLLAAAPGRRSQRISKTPSPQPAGSSLPSWTTTRPNTPNRRRCADSWPSRPTACATNAWWRFRSARRTTWIPRRSAS